MTLTLTHSRSTCEKTHTHTDSENNKSKRTDVPSRTIDLQPARSTWKMDGHFLQSSSSWQIETHLENGCPFCFFFISEPARRLKVHWKALLDTEGDKRREQQMILLSFCESPSRSEAGTSSQRRSRGEKRRKKNVINSFLETV